MSSKVTSTRTEAAQTIPAATLKAARARGVFVTGTDTGVGKTHCSVALIHALRRSGVDAIGFKPVASGCAQTPAGWRNDDAVALQLAGASVLEYSRINPYALRAPIAPHAAAAADGARIELPVIQQAYRGLQGDADWIVVEGAGGWCVPLDDGLMQAAIPQALALPVILVVGLRLGCINHALLSAAAIRADGCQLLGWIGNRIDPQMANPEASLASLTQWMPAPLLGELGFEPDPASAVTALQSAVTMLRS